MNSSTPSKLRKGPFVPIKNKPQFGPNHATILPMSLAPVYWNGIDLAPIAQSLSGANHPQIVWKIFVKTLSSSLGEYALALTQTTSSGKNVLIAHDGIHEALAKHIATNPQELAPPAPNEYAERHHLTANDNPETHSTLLGTFEFIDHCWQWNVYHTNASRLTLSLYGADDEAPGAPAENAVLLARYVAHIVQDEKKRSQNSSEMAALMQGRKQQAGEVLLLQLTHWLTPHGKAK